MSSDRLPGVTAEAPSGSLTGTALPISKLRDVPLRARALLKARRITTCVQLLAAAGPAAQRAELSVETGLDPGLLLAIAHQADMVRVKGVGSVFGMMLEDLGISRVPDLAAQEPAALHEALRRYNDEARVSRRSPTPEEVADWVRQAGALPPVIT